MSEHSEHVDKYLNQVDSSDLGDVLPQAPNNNEVTLECTLSELYNGAMKSFEFTKQRLCADGKTLTEEKEKLNVEIEPGMSEATKIIFPLKGNQAYAHADSVLVVSIKQVEDEHFRREGNDLIYTHSVSLEDAIRGEPVSLKTLDGRTLRFQLNGQIGPNSVHEVKGEGMPLYDKVDKDRLLQAVGERAKGDLRVRFNVVFPQRLSEEQRERAIQILTN